MSLGFLHLHVSPLFVRAFHSVHHPHSHLRYAPERRTNDRREETEVNGSSERWDGRLVTLSNHHAVGKEECNDDPVPFPFRSFTPCLRLSVHITHGENGTGGTGGESNEPTTVALRASSRHVLCSLVLHPPSLRCVTRPLRGRR